MQSKYLLAVLLPAIALMAITPTVYANNGASHFVGYAGDGSGCFAVDATGHIDFDHTYDWKAVQTPSNNEHSSCVGQMDYSGPELHFDSSNAVAPDGTPLQCSGTVNYVTSNWHETLHSDGKFNLQCEFNPASNK